MENRKEMIMKRVNEHFEYLKSCGYEVMFTALQGSQNYGLDEYSDEYTSDIDTKSVVLPSLDDFVYNEKPISTIRIMPDSEEHAEVKDIRVMFEMFRKENLSYIELLYSDYVVINPKYLHWVDLLFNNRERIVNADKHRFLMALMGTAYEKRKQLCHPFPTVEDKINKYGYDGKQLSHCARIAEFMTRYTSGEPVAACFKTKQKEYLLELKKQIKPLPLDKALKLADEYCTICATIADKTTKTEIDDSTWDFLNTMQAKVMKQYILECVNAQKEE